MNALEHTSVAADYRHAEKFAHAEPSLALGDTIDVACDECGAERLGAITDVRFIHGWPSRVWQVRTGSDGPAATVHASGAIIRPAGTLTNTVR